MGLNTFGIDCLLQTKIFIMLSVAVLIHPAQLITKIFTDLVRLLSKVDPIS